MIKKDYIAFAEMFDHAAKTNFNNVAIEDRSEWIANGLADIFAKDNPHFDREKFLKACGF